MEAFTVLVLRYLDAGCSAEEISRLKEFLTSSVAHRERFVQVCRMTGNLQEAFSTRRAELQHKKASVAEPVAAPALAGPTSSEALASPAGPEQPETMGAFALDPAGATDGTAKDPGAETVTRELSAENTAHPVSKVPKK
jgi:hypothetical protein